jgi:hypothetical protein
VDTTALTQDDYYFVVAQVEAAFDGDEPIRTEEMAAADATLIAAAPDLLAACGQVAHGILHWAQQTDDRTGDVAINRSTLDQWHKALTRAAAKAEGGGK